MNPDAAGSLVRQILTAVLSGGAADAYANNDQIAAIVSGAAALASVAWSIYSHYGMKKVPQGATVVGGGK